MSTKTDTQPVLKTPAEWLEFFNDQPGDNSWKNVVILDPDGWRSDGKSFDEPIDLEEFEDRAMSSTIGPRHWR